jgi:hypothetical protein
MNVYLDNQKTGLFLNPERGRTSSKTVLILWLGFRFIGVFTSVDEAKETIVNSLAEAGVTYTELLLK